jgi:deoxyribose-phosphate aldolase
VIGDFKRVSIRKGTKPNKCTVVGFPLGASYDSSVLTETELAIVNGAKEIDMVMNVGAFKSGNYKEVERSIQNITNFAHSFGTDIVVKVIVESAVLTEAEKDRIATIILNETNADFLKTSTGFVPNDKLVQDVSFFSNIIKGKIGIKAAGGIRTYEIARQLVECGATRIGASSTKKLLEKKRNKKFLFLVYLLFKN